MIDRLFLAALTFCLLLGSTVAIGVEMFRHPTAAAPVYQLERVVVNGKRVIDASVAKAAPLSATAASSRIE